MIKSKEKDKRRLRNGLVDVTILIGLDESTPLKPLGGSVREDQSWLLAQQFTVSCECKKKGKKSQKKARSELFSHAFSL